MSQWTHINAAIRFDGIKGMTPIPNLNCKVPHGSEGPLRYNFVEVGDGATRFTVSIWGDLRDFGRDRVKEITDYLAEIIVGQLIRSGIAEIEVEGDEAMVLRVVNDGDDIADQKWIQVSP